MDRDEIWAAWARAGHAGCEGWMQDPDGPVICSCRAFIIPVTGKHVADAVPSVTGNPVALAVRDAFPKASHVVAGASTLYLTRDGWREEYALPESALSFLTAFYDGKPVGGTAFSVPGEPAFRYRFRPAAETRRWAA